MRKLIYPILVISAVLFTIGIAQQSQALSEEVTDPRGTTKEIATGKIIPYGYCFNILRQGTTGPQVEDLQTILKTDSTIYPEGLVTGYYGPLTKGAVERLQSKFGLAQTGEVDEETARIILPCPIDVKLTVISPNGGEVWDRNNIYQITWKLSKADSVEPIPMPDIHNRFFWPYGRIDLIRSDGTFVKHIATVNLAYQSYDWQISSSIPNGSDYKIRIGLGPVVACKDGDKCPLLMPPYYTFGDESDGSFSITGTTPPPSDKIQEAIDVLQKVLEQLNKLLALLQSLR